jgi:hypothetical protein
MLSFLLFIQKYIQQVKLFSKPKKVVQLLQVLLGAYSLGWICENEYIEVEWPL